MARQLGVGFWSTQREEVRDQVATVLFRQGRVDSQSRQDLRLVSDRVEAIVEVLLLNA